MNRKFRKALKKAYDIPKPIHRDEFLDSLKKRYPKVRKCRYTLFYSKNVIRLMSALLTVLFVIGVHSVYYDISYLYQLPISDPSQTDSSELPQLSQDEDYPVTTDAVTKSNNHNNKITSSFTDASESSEINSDLHKNSSKNSDNTNKITKTTQTQPKVTALITKQENIITKSTVSNKPSNSGAVSQIHTKPSIPSEDQVIVTTNNHHIDSEGPNNDSTANVVTTFVGHLGTNNHEPLSSSITTNLGFQNEESTTVSSTTVQTKPTTIPISGETDADTGNNASKTYPDIYFNREKMLYDDS